MVFGSRAAHAADALLLRCPICIDELRAPVVLKCGHRFCDPCIRTALTIKSDCPTCRTPVASHRELRADMVLSQFLGCSQPPRAMTAADEVCAAGEKWTCGKCTLENLLVASRCMVCSARRPAHAVRVPLAAAAVRDQDDDDKAEEWQVWGEAQVPSMHTPPPQIHLATAANGVPVEPEEEPEGYAGAGLAAATAPPPRAPSARTAGSGEAPARTASSEAAAREHALQVAQAEGLTLRKADNKSGYANVSVQHGRWDPYQAQMRRGGKDYYLGRFATAEEAALCVARSPEGQAAAGREKEVEETCATTATTATTAITTTTATATTTTATGTTTTTTTTTTTMTTAAAAAAAAAATAATPLDDQPRKAPTEAAKAVGKRKRRADMVARTGNQHGSRDSRATDERRCPACQH